MKRARNSGPSLGLEVFKVFLLDYNHRFGSCEVTAFDGVVYNAAYWYVCSVEFNFVHTFTAFTFLVCTSLPVTSVTVKVASPAAGMLKLTTVLVLNGFGSFWYKA